MLILRVGPDGHGGSRLAPVELLEPRALRPDWAMSGSEPLASPRVQFATLPAEYAEELHPAPNRLFVIVLGGRVEVGTSHGSAVLEPRSVLMADDMGTTGHTTATVDGAASVLFVQASEASGLFDGD